MQYFKAGVLKTYHQKITLLNWENFANDKITNNLKVLLHNVAWILLQKILGRMNFATFITIA